AEMVTPEKFFYTNNTSTSPADSKLAHIAGSGSSPLIRYDGTGAYFLDKISPGVWRLEVMPDAIWIRDPFTKASPHHEMAVIDWQEREMSIALSDLADDFAVRPLNDGNSYEPKVKGNNITVRPGAYLIVGSGHQSQARASDSWGVIRLGEFSAPQPSSPSTYVIHNPPVEVTEGTALRVDATVATLTSGVPNVELLVAGVRGRPQVLKMDRKSAYKYEAVIPAESVHAGYLQYYISVSNAGELFTYPGKVQGRPALWDFEGTEPYQVPVVTKNAPIYLFNAEQDANSMTRPWLRTSSVVPGDEPSTALLQVSVEKLFVPDPENRNSQAIHDYSFRSYAGDKIAVRASDVNQKNKIIVRGRSLNGHDATLQ